MERNQPPQQQVPHDDNESGKVAGGRDPTKQSENNIAQPGLPSEPDEQLEDEEDDVGEPAQQVQ